MLIRHATFEFERLTNYIDKDIAEDVENKDELQTDIVALQANITRIKKEAEAVIEYNKQTTAHNTKVDVVTEQLIEYNNSIGIEAAKLDEVSQLLAKLDVLKRSFSPSGLISYKLEYLVKDLETEINTYLSEFSDGRFQLTFVLNGDKLNIEILDDNIPISITALSTGQLARVNTSTLLAIRKLMSAISNTKLNTLFLDEVMGVLDAEGKERLIEVLFKEDSLNTFIVSHDYNNPLLTKIEVMMENKTSWIEYG